jgi:methyl-accepting chemotaxis protein
MLNNLKIGHKLLIGFGLVLGLGVLLGGLAVVKMSIIAPQAKHLAEGQMPAVEISTKIINAIHYARTDFRGYGLTGQNQFIEGGRKYLAETQSLIDQAATLAAAQKDEKFSASLKEAKTSAEGYGASVNETEKYYAEQNQIRERMDAGSKAFAEAIDAYFDAIITGTSNDIMGQPDQTKANAQSIKLRMAQDIMQLNTECQTANFKAQALRQPKLIEDALPNFNKIQASVDQILAVTTDAGEREGLAKLLKSGLAYKAEMSAMLDVYGRLDTIANQRNVVSAAVVEACSKSLSDNVKEASTGSTATAIQLFTTKNIIFSGLIVMVLLGLGAAFLITRQITGPLQACLPVFEAVSNGDLTRRIEVKTHDEVGLVAGKFNQVIDQLSGIINQLTNTSREVASASTEIAASAEQMAAGMREQSTQTQQISAAVEEMSSTTMEVARKAGDAASSARQSEERATEGGQVVDGAISEINAVANMVRETATAIGELGERGQQIGEIISVINDIADQTNLLALNAAIEAARAGEHGRGFAVVADEVRKLAERTTLATKEVAASIKAIQTGTAGAVDRMHAGTSQVGRAVDQAQQAGAALTMIISDVQNVTGMIQSIAAASEQQSAAGEEISRNLESITAVTAQSADGANQSASAASHLSQKSELLQEIVSKFKV